MSDFKLGISNNEVDINDEWIVLDIGSGHNPHPRANVLADKYLLDNIERSGKGVKIGGNRDFVMCDAEFLPFRNKVFDFIIASHIAEHIVNPKNFCEELMRIGKSGYIETPSRFSEIFLKEPFHRWRVYVKGQTLIFEKNDDMGPKSDFFYRFFYYGQKREGREALAYTNRIINIFFKVSSGILRFLWMHIPNITYTRFRWMEAFKFIILNEDDQL
jgi:hypothetical protein